MPPTARTPLTRARVLADAVALADAEGVEAVSMCRVAERLGVVPMALYKHVADKDDLPLLQSMEASAARFGASDMKVRNMLPDRFLEDGETVSFGGHVFEVYHTPGHAPGHVIYFNREQNFAHLGDVLFNGSIGRTDLPGGDHETLLRSIKTKVLPLGDEVGFICGHGPGSRIGDERRSNPFLRGI